MTPARYGGCPPEVGTVEAPLLRPIDQNGHDGLTGAIGWVRNRSSSVEVLTMPTPSARDNRWPPLPLAAWQDTYTTLHRWTQIVGKTRLAFAPMQNHWWQVALYVTARGLGTSPMPFSDGDFEVEFDFVDHALTVRTTGGRTASMPLGPQSVEAFYRRYLETLASLSIRPKIWPVPAEMPDTLRFTDDREHASYDADAAHRCWLALVQADRVLKQFRGRFLGKSSPSHFWWGAFDLACTVSPVVPRRRIRAACRTSPTASREKRTRTSASAPAGGLARQDPRPRAGVLRLRVSRTGRMSGRSHRPGRWPLRPRDARVDPALRRRAHRNRPRCPSARVPPEHLRSGRDAGRLGPGGARTRRQ